VMTSCRVIMTVSAPSIRPFTSMKRRWSASPPRRCYVQLLIVISELSRWRTRRFEQRRSIRRFSRR
jgi:hypothetical protein